MLTTVPLASCKTAHDNHTITPSPIHHHTADTSPGAGNNVLPSCKKMQPFASSSIIVEFIILPCIMQPICNLIPANKLPRPFEPNRLSLTCYKQRSRNVAYNETSSRSNS